MPSVLVTGANRGIGLDLARQYAAEGWRVMATCRDPAAASDLTAVTGEITVYPLEITDPASVAQLQATLADQPIDVLFNNAGIYQDKGLSAAETDYELWARTMDINVFGQIRVSNALRENVAASTRRQMVFVSSKMGSLAECAGGAMIYRSSKAALNMAVQVLSMEVEPMGITCALLHPGHVRTKLGGDHAPVQPAESAAGMRQVVESLTTEDNGTFRSYDGTPLPW